MMLIKIVLKNVLFLFKIFLKLHFLFAQSSIFKRRRRMHGMKKSAIGEGRVMKLSIIGEDAG
jgi:hypothetical protein